MKFKTLLFILLVIFLVISVSADVKNEKTLNLTAEGIEAFNMECGAGSLDIVGVTDLKQLEVKATIVVKGIDKGEMDDFIKEYVHLSLEKKGEKAVLVSTIDSNWVSSLFHSKEARIDLEIRIPARMTLDIEDGSGSIKIAHIDGNIKLDDGSGSIQIQEVSGNINIADGSGSIDMEQIGGNVTIEDGSGELNMKKIGGKVSIDDGSGEINLYEIKGNVDVDDGSGSILIDGVDADVEIINAGSGSVTIRNVKGKVKK